MLYNPDLHHRRSIRLKGYDYSQNGVYFITICTQNRACLFGEIINEKIRMNDAGEMIKKWWFELKNKFNHIQLDEYIIMPNHFHGIICVDNNDEIGQIHEIQIGQTHRSAPTENDLNNQNVVGANLCVRPDPCIRPNVNKIIQWFKTMTTNEYINNVKNNNWPPFNKKLWQRNYYEHIVRNEKSLTTIREYIINNPCRWKQDELFLEK